MTAAERFSRWLYRRYGTRGARKPVWAWTLEAALYGWWPRRHQRHMFLGEAPSIDELR